MAAVLHREHSVEGLCVFAGLFVMVWWSWWGYTWYSAAFNDDDTVNRLALLSAMGGVAILAAGTSGVAGGSSTAFAMAYALLFGLLAALYWRAYFRFPKARPLSARYAVGDTLGACVWLASIAFPEYVRPYVWAVAMVLLMTFPVLAARSLAVISYEPGHIAERYGLFTLIVLGESIVATVAGLDTQSSASAILVGFMGLVIAGSIWWLYFDRFRGMPAGGIASGWVWAQGHLFVFAGIAAAAVGVEFAIEAAAEGHDLVTADRLPLGAGLASFLAAMALIRAATRRPDRICGLRGAACAAVLLLSLLDGISPLMYVGLSASIMAIECVLDLLWAPPERSDPAPLPHRLARVRGS